MDNLSYADSGDSSPRYHEIATDNNNNNNNNNKQQSSSWDDSIPPLQSSNSAPAVPTFTSYKVKFMCSYGGKIQPRPNYILLAYIGGDTKILAVDRNIKFPAIMAKLTSLCGAGDSDVCFKYQLPGEDLDALISVTNDEDLEHMMMEYDRSYRASAKPARLRLFLFPLNPCVTPFGSDEIKSERQWFVDALNSVPVQASEGSSPPSATKAAAAVDPAFLFGLDKGVSHNVAAEGVADSVPAVPELVAKNFSEAGSDCGSEDQRMIGDPTAASPTEIQRHIQGLQRMQIAAGIGGGGIEQGGLQRTCYDGDQRVYSENYYKVPEKVMQAPPAPVQVPYPTTYMPERNMASVGYPMGVAASPNTEQQQVYLIPAGGGVYHSQALRPAAGPGPSGQAYYSVYNQVPQSAAIPQPQMVGGYNDGFAIMQQQPKTGAATEQGFMQVGYDGAGRQVYYTTTSPVGVSGSPQYQASVAVDGRQANSGGNNSNQDGKVVVNAMAPQTSSL